MIYVILDDRYAVPVEVASQIKKVKREGYGADSPWLVDGEPELNTLVMGDRIKEGKEAEAISLESAKQKAEDAEAILNKRKSQLFKSFDDLNEIQNLSQEGKELILANRFDQAYFESVEFPEELSIKSVITAPLKRLGLIFFIYFVLTLFPL